MAQGRARNRNAPPRRGERIGRAALGARPRYGPCEQERVLVERLGRADQREESQHDSQFGQA